MNQVQAQIPTNTQNPAAYAAGLQGAMTQLQNTINNNATEPLCIIYQASSVNSDSQSTSSTSPTRIANWTWTFQSEGGLVCVAASISGSGNGYASLVIDGNTALQVPLTSGCLLWNAILGQGGHTITINFGSVSGSVTVNPAGGFTSAVSVYELPQNVQSQ